MKTFKVLTLAILLAFLDAGHGSKGEEPPQIIGGSEAGMHEFPWQASLISAYNKHHFCGGSLISSRWVLTAAHCLVNDDKSLLAPEGIAVRLGAHYRKWPAPGEFTFKAKKLIAHERFDPGDDIGLVLLTSEVKLTEAIGTVALPKYGSSPEGRPVIITGWGSTDQFFYDENGIAEISYCRLHFPIWYSTRKSQLPRSTPCGELFEVETEEGIIYVTAVPYVLQKVEVPVMPEAQCKKLRKAKEKEWCVGKVKLGSCYGDSGGPMVQKVDGNWTVFGVTSHGVWAIEECSPQEGASRYTKVTEYLDWIHRQMKSQNR